MRNIYLTLLIFLTFSIPLFPQSVIRINQLGYQPDAIKVAVLMSEDGNIPNEFYIEDVFTGKVVFSSKTINNKGPIGNFKGTARLNFSELHTNGTFKIIFGKLNLPIFESLIQFTIQLPILFCNICVNNDVDITPI
jgi:endoglucanase